MSLLDKNWRYVPSHSTNVAKTIRRVKLEQKRAAEAAAQAAPAERVEAPVVRSPRLVRGGRS